MSDDVVKGSQINACNAEMAEIVGSIVSAHGALHSAAARLRQIGWTLSDGYEQRGILYGRACAKIESATTATTEAELAARYLRDNWGG